MKKILNNIGYYAFAAFVLAALYLILRLITLLSI